MDERRRVGSARRKVAQCGRVGCGFVSSCRVADDLDRHSASGQRGLEVNAPAATGDQRLKLLELSAPNGFHIAIACRIACHLRNAEADRSHLQAVGLHSSREFDAVVRIGGLPQHNSAPLHPSGRHSFVDLVAEARKPLKDRTAPGARRQDIKLLGDQHIGLPDQIGCGCRILGGERDAKARDQCPRFDDS